MSEKPNYSPDYQEVLVSNVKSDLDPSYMKAAGMAAEEGSPELAKKFVRLAGEESREHPWIERHLAEQPTDTKILKDAIFKMMTEKGDLPLHAIKRELESTGIRIPGKGTDANLLGHLDRDPRFIKKSRGVYGLSGD